MLWLFKIKFRGFRRFLIHGNSSYVVLYTQCLRYNICCARFLDIRISTCSDCKQNDQLNVMQLKGRSNQNLSGQVKIISQASTYNDFQMIVACGQHAPGLKKKVSVVAFKF